MIRLALLGPTGRMGTRTMALAADDQRFRVVAALTGPDDPQLGQVLRAGPNDVTVTDRTDAAVDVMIDFSVPAGTMNWLDHCRRTRTAMVIGVTGYTPDQVRRIESAAGEIPVLLASNFSVGINALLALVGRLARSLGETYDVEIVETHHSRKIDAPSGTALSLRDVIIESTGRSAERDVIYGRHGQTGTRPAGQIGIHAVRMGDVVGQHEIHFAGPDETLTLRHAAHSRATFARGALEAAAWIAGRPPGNYSMQDVLAVGF